MENVAYAPAVHSRGREAPRKEVAMRTRSVIFAAVIALGLVVPSRSFAGHHLWRLTQIFSNASGSVQFMELFVADNNEPSM